MNKETVSTPDKIKLEGVSKRYAMLEALSTVDLSIKSGEFVTLLGPSGSGKTTLLNLIAGTISPSAGRIWINGKDATNIPTNHRGLGMVFQNYALLPHLTVAENIAFPLRVRRLPEAEIRKKVAHVLNVVHLSQFSERKPSELSGGQQQRIAIARCIVYDPTIILMDEPLGALDKKLREEMQLEIKQIHKRLGITILYVTHDQEEALTMSDKVVLLNKGRIEQMDPPIELYFHPKTLFAAQFLGDSNIIEAKVDAAGSVVSAVTKGGAILRSQNPLSVKSGQDVKLMVRPQNAELCDADDSNFDNKLHGTMVDTIILGGIVRGYVKLETGDVFVFQGLTRTKDSFGWAGSYVTVGWSSRDTIALP